VTSDRPRSSLVAPAIAIGLAAVVLAAFLGVYLVLTAAPLATGPAQASALDPVNVPPVGQVWFGTAYDARTLQIAGRGDAFTTGSTVAMVAHLSAPVASGRAAVRVELNGTQLASNVLNMPGAGSGDVVAWTQAFPAAGPYRITVVVAASGALLATGDVTAR
jgi:hypothetical protein